MHALILGGTHEGRELARLLVDAGWYVTSSLAGRVAAPRLPVGRCGLVVLVGLPV